MEHKNLRNDIESLQIEASGASFTFNKRLARENFWSKKFADKVVTEYKRFIYLAAISKKEITPSDQIDQAWHLHLTYTKSYWKDLCEDILGFELHHNPTKGGTEEQKRFRAQYIYTLSFYEKVYGEKPPDDVWPAVDKRFEALKDFVRVNRQKTWIVQKPALMPDKLLVLIIMPMLLVACTDYFNDKDIWFWLKTAFGVFIAYKVIKWLWSISDHPGGSGCSSGCGSGCGGCGGCGG